MFTLSEELKFYEPGLEVVEESLSGDPEKDLLEMMKILLKEKSSPAAKLEEKVEEVPAEEEEKAEEKAAE